jgi:hypothetical protein
VTRILFCRLLYPDTVCALLRFHVSSQECLSSWHKHITADNIADLLHLAVNSTACSWCPAQHLIYSIAHLVFPEYGAPANTRMQISNALQQPGLSESLLRTLLLREPVELRIVMLDLKRLPGMRPLTAAAALSIFQEVLTNGRQDVFAELCGVHMAALDVQGLQELLGMLLRRSDAAGFVHALADAPTAQQLEAGQVGKTEGVSTALCFSVLPTQGC